MLRWGIVSTAKIGRNAVIPAIHASGNGELVGVASRDADRAREFAAETSIPNHYGSYEALLDADDVDAVYIPLPNSLHHEWTIKSAEAGKHVLCEKPLGLTAAECVEMDAAARENGVKLMEAFMYRFHPRTERVIELVRGGAIGPLRALRASFTFRLTESGNIRLDPELGGGALMDVGCYCVNIARTLAGAEPVEVQALAHWSDSGVDEQMAGTLRFEDGLLAQIDCALSLERRQCYTAAGPDGYLDVEAAYVPGTGETTIEEQRGRGAKTTHAIDGADQYQVMVEHFADCVAHDRDVRYPAMEAAANMRVIEALYASARARGTLTGCR